MKKVLVVICDDADAELALRRALRHLRDGAPASYTDAMLMLRSSANSIHFGPSTEVHE